MLVPKKECPFIQQIHWINEEPGQEFGGVKVYFAIFYFFLNIYTYLSNFSEIG